MTGTDTAFHRWIRHYHPATDAAARLVCFPHAGGSATFFFPAARALAPDVDVLAIQYPGRQDRRTEPLLDSIEALAEPVAAALIADHDGRPLTLFGHSMGALVAFETARALRHAGARLPLALFLAAYPAATGPITRTPIHELPDREFIAEMRRMQGTPAAVLDNAELMAFLLPILRSDFQACDTYACVAEPPLDCPLFVYGGDADADVDRPSLERWREVTTGGFTLTMFPGTHFFVQSQSGQLLADIASRLGTLGI